MCGIYSILNSSPDDQKSLETEFLKIQHRGPDNSKFNPINNNVLFGFHRLRINGLDEQSDQPFRLDNTYLICNGEIFNHKELINNYEFNTKSKSDCEVILHMYKRFGIHKTIESLDGEFAFCLYDDYSKKFYITRDHIGIRPLFIGSNDNDTKYGFASEAKALLSFQTIKQYSPGFYSEFTVGQKDFITSKWYDYNIMDTVSNGHIGHIGKYYKNYPNATRDQLLSEVKYRVIKSVHDRTDLSERPIGCFLSGGLDSSLVTSIMSRKNKNIHCFSIGIEGSLDLIAAKKVGEYLKLTNHHIVTVTIKDVIDSIPHVIKSLESYDITTIRASIFQWLLSKYVKEHTDVVVLLSGELPDESIPGYYAFAFCKTDEEFVELSRSMIEELHEYDLLRTDRTTANFGLEVRVPFAEKKLLRLFHNIDTKFRKFDQNTIEKSLLRDAFKGDWLPESILYRKKHAFSDGVSNQEVCVYKEIEKFAESVIKEDEWSKRNELYPKNTPISKESFYYRKIFESMYSGRHDLIRGFWMPKIKDENGEYILDPSATALPGHKIDTEF